MKALVSKGIIVGMLCACLAKNNQCLALAAHAVSISEAESTSHDSQKAKLRKKKSRGSSNMIMADLAQVGFMTLAAAGSIWLHDRVVDDKKDSYATRLMTALGVSTIASGVIQKPVQRLYNRLSVVLFPANMVDEKMRLYVEYKTRYEQIKDRLDAGTQEVIENKLYVYNERIQQEWGKEQLPIFERVLEDLLSLPTGLDELKDDFLPEMKQVLQPYSDHTKAAMKSFVEEVELQHQSPHPMRVSPVLFVGPPGTGKTSLARKFAKASGLKLNEINVNQYKNATELEGMTNPWGEEYHRGIVLETYANSNGAKNAILFIDEVDKALNTGTDNLMFVNSLKSFLLHILEPSNSTILAKSVGVELNIEHLIIIMTANQDFKEEALKQRVNRVYFDGFDTATKEKIAMDYARKFGLKADSETSQVISEVVAEDKSCGLRVMIHVLKRYAIFKQSSQHFGSLYEESEKRNFNVKEIIRMAESSL